MMAVLLVVVSSVSVVAVTEIDSRSGFWGSISCVLFGDPAVRASIVGEAFERNLVG